jgi:phosphatidylglycerophosphatase A
MQTQRGHIINRLSKYFSTLGFVGYIPYAPGTFGSAIGFLLIFLLRSDDPTLLYLFSIFFIPGLFASNHAEKFLGKDSKHIVIDELCGYLFTLLLLPKTTPYLIAAFVLFRFFDILKPPPIKSIEKKLSGGAGIMFDDIIAAVYANLCIQIWRYFF